MSRDYLMAGRVVAGLITTGDRVEGSVPLTPLAGVGVFDLAGVLWPRFGTNSPLFVDEIRSMFASEERFVELVFAGVPPTRMTQIFPTSESYRSHLQYLAGVGVVRGPQAAGTGVLFATYFAVAKVVVDFVALEARAIFNLRAANAFAERDVRMSTFSISELLKSLGSLRRAVTFVEADLLNFFYQLAIPQWMERLVALQIGERREEYTATVLPMGWDRSCRVAQAITVGGVGHRLVEEDTLGLPQEAAQEALPPSLLELNWRGAWGLLAVIYDTIFVAVTNEELANLWEERIRRNFAFLRLELKYLRKTRATCFDGIEVRRGRVGVEWRVAQDTLDIWATVVLRLVDTPRALWKGMGFLRRIGEVQLRPRHWLSDVTREQARLASENADRLQDESWWDAEIVNHSWIRAIQQYTRNIQNIWFSRELLRRNTKRRMRNTLRFVAVDATLKLISIAVFDENLNIHEWPEARKTATDGDINEHEAAAMRWGSERCTEADIMVVGGDNTAVSRAFWKGWSLAEGVQKHMWVPRECTTRIIVDLPSEDNIADVKTRPDEHVTASEVEYRKKMTILRFRRALEAHEKWQGDTYFARGSPIFDNLEEQSS